MLPKWHWSLQPNAEEIRQRMSASKKGKPGGSRKGIGGWKVENRISPKCQPGCTCTRHTTINSGTFYPGRPQTNPNSLAALRRGAEALAERRRGIGDYDGTFTYTLKSLVWQRDGSRCRLCGRENEKGSGRALVVHHLDYDKSNNALENLVLLCRGCHLGGHAAGAWPTDLKQATKVANGRGCRFASFAAALVPTTE